jgi:hypothetical protein
MAIDKKYYWKKGQSGNPAGRPVGTSHQEFFDEIMKSHKADLVKLAIDKAKSGKSPIILKFLLERFVPKAPLHPLEYEKLLLENEKLRKENKILDEAPALLDMIRDDPLFIERLREKQIKLIEDKNEDKVHKIG